MINLEFMPSRQVALYVVKLFLTRSLAVLVALVLILMTLDLLGESGKILAVPGNGDAQLWQYVGLRLPLLISRFLPFSVLLGTLIAFAGLNQHSEVIAMKAAGISAHQILAPLIVASVGIAAVAFAFNETVVVKAFRKPDEDSSPTISSGDDPRTERRAMPPPISMYSLSERTGRRSSTLETSGIKPPFDSRQRSVSRRVPRTLRPPREVLGDGRSIAEL